MTNTERQELTNKVLATGTTELESRVIVFIMENNYECGRTLNECNSNYMTVAVPLRELFKESGIQVNVLKGVLGSLVKKDLVEQDESKVYLDTFNEDLIKSVGLDTKIS